MHEFASESFALERYSRNELQISRPLNWSERQFEKLFAFDSAHFDVSFASHISPRWTHNGQFAKVGAPNQTDHWVKSTRRSSFGSAYVVPAGRWWRSCNVRTADHSTHCKIRKIQKHIKIIISPVRLLFLNFSHMALEAFLTPPQTRVAWQI